MTSEVLDLSSRNMNNTYDHPKIVIGVFMYFFSIIQISTDYQRTHIPCTLGEYQGE